MTDDYSDTLREKRNEITVCDRKQRRNPTLTRAANSDHTHNHFVSGIHNHNASSDHTRNDT